MTLLEEAKSETAEVGKTFLVRLEFEPAYDSGVGHWPDNWQVKSYARRKRGGYKRTGITWFTESKTVYSRAGGFAKAKELFLQKAAQPGFVRTYSVLGNVVLGGGQ